MKTGEADKCNVTTANSKPKARTENQLAPDQNKVTRLLARETKQQGSSDRFASPPLISAIEETFSKITSILAGTSRALPGQAIIWTSFRDITGSGTNV